MGWRIEIAPCAAADPGIRRFIRSIPDIFDTGGDALHDARNTIKEFATGSTTTPRAVVKKFKPLDTFKSVVYTCFRTTKAFRAYHNALELRARGISTPQPLAYLERRERGLVKDCYYVTAPTALRPIRDGLWTPEGYDPVMARDFARFTARLHAHGVLHHDLNSTNVLYSGDAATGYDFQVIDINRMDFTPIGQMPTLRQCMENLTRFTNSLEIFGRVARLYIAERGLEADLAPAFDRAKKRFADHRARNKKIKRAFKHKK